MTPVNPFLLCYASLIPEFYCCDGALWMHNATPGPPRPPRSLRKPAPPSPPAPPAPPSRPLRSILKNGATHRNQTLVPRDAQDGGGGSIDPAGNGVATVWDNGLSTEWTNLDACLPALGSAWSTGQGSEATSVDAAGNVYGLAIDNTG